VYATIWMILIGIRGTFEEKQKNNKKASKRCVRNDLDDFDGYSGDTPRDAKAQLNNTKTLCTQRFGRL
jgi:hypothetical protein